MSDFEFWSWDKKPRTMLRFVKPGDIFCFKLAEDKYCFGRVMAKITGGHVVEFFDYTSMIPKIDKNIISSSKRVISPIVIDSYGLFDKKSHPESDWRIVGHQNNFSPENVEELYFSYGIGDFCKKKDIFGNVFSISEEEANKIPELNPHSDYLVKSLLSKI
ncbi:immunity 26/phosphotriesterase HocA family protein [Escherichia marmotae]|uniref:Immunity 26/phosphotriesterase HocA family protein n=1 Tax=Escherichia marmotae TaxID=1499973 RepID=A0A7W3APM4_9ESCH|nr:immunity 26/phosphotriesterase HocA family protein [Escherichia marmotae]HAI8717694.1 phosphotriesterase [Escherichia coli]MBA7901130.1 immunity 26/phosphotriesterase HocA family protein [Escherichia marmotae]MEC9629593.1 immunity 26/phosphotriesterase HocA family protein [Escherichia marmotae]MED0364459.1 immunity 26/phosphotriesterase HocA family protein [Escherichia marmotae]MED8777194.1 immunity 26/phosphotriesterase HocA family protein [Escherichia marmotae]